MNRAMIRARIDALECLTDTQTAIEEVQGVEWEPGDRGTLDLQITTSGDHKGVTFIHGVPPSVLVAGLRAMEAKLCEMSGMEVVAISSYDAASLYCWNEPTSPPSAKGEK